LRASLPVDAHLDALGEALARHGAAVLVAPPGTGKSTRVPPFLLDRVPPESSVLLLQPRRAAARLLAARIAAERGQPLGEEVGYRVRHESRRSARTRLEVLTEGLLTRRLLDDPLLEAGAWGRPVGAVVLDEVHERGLNVDLALALLDEVRQARPELLLVLMSATIDPGPFSRYLGEAPVLRVEARTFPVEVEHQGPDLDPADREAPARVARAVREGLRRSEGDLLAFLPGVAEIQQVAALLADLGPEVAVLPLHGSLPSSTQDLALREGPPPGAGRKVVLSTDLAETSLTIPGVRVVVDSGLCRRPTLDPASGLERLRTVLISRASAEQRAGRAGRTGPGLCLRLWSAHQHSRREEDSVAEIQRLDLAPTALAVAAWGSPPRWLDPPPAAAWAQAQGLLSDLGALDGRGLTSLGRRLAALPVHPRVGRMLLEARGSPTAAALAALLEERDPWPRGDRTPVEQRLRAVLGGPGGSASQAGLSSVREAARQLARLVEGGRPLSVDELILCLLAGFPERLGRRRQAGEPRVQLASGRGAVLAPDAQDDGAEWIVAITLRAPARGEDRVELCLPLTAEEVARLPRQRHRTSAWEEERQAVVARAEERFGALVLSQREVQPDLAEAAQALVQVLQREPTRLLDPSAATRGLVHRVLYLRQRRGLGPEWEELDDALRAVLPALCQGRRRLSDLRGGDLHDLLRAQLGYALLAELDRLAPSSFRLPTGREVELDYDPQARQGAGPVLRARIQQLLGLDRTPTVLGGAEPVTLHLLAPNDRPVQVTTDLAGFWVRTWPEVRKDLRGRYPRHSWPEDPLTAAPQDRPARRGVGRG